MNLFLSLLAVNDSQYIFALVLYRALTSDKFVLKFKIDAYYGLKL